MRMIASDDVLATISYLLFVPMDSRRIARMTLKELKSIGRELGVFLAMFASFVGRRLLKIYVQGQLSDIKNKNCEAIALKFDQTPSWTASLF